MAWGTGTTTKDVSAYSGPQGADSFDFEVGSGVPSVKDTPGGKTDFYLVDTFPDWNEQIRQHGTLGEHLQNIFSKRNLSREFQPEIDALKDTGEYISGLPEKAWKGLKDSSVGEAVKDLSTWEGWWDAIKEAGAPVTNTLDTATSMASGITNVVPSALTGGGTLLALMKQGMPYGEAVRIAAQAAHKVDEFIPDYRPQTEFGQKFEHGIQAVFGTLDQYISQPVGNAAAHFTGSEDFGKTVAGALNGAFQTAPFARARTTGLRNQTFTELNPFEIKARAKSLEKELNKAINDEKWIEDKWRTADPEMWASLSEKELNNLRWNEIPKVQESFRTALKDLTIESFPEQSGGALATFGYNARGTRNAPRPEVSDIPTWRDTVADKSQIYTDRLIDPIRKALGLDEGLAGFYVSNMVARALGGKEGVHRWRGGLAPFTRPNVRTEIKEYPLNVADTVMETGVADQRVLPHEGVHWADFETFKQLSPIDYEAALSILSPGNYARPKKMAMLPDYKSFERPVRLRNEPGYQHDIKGPYGGSYSRHASAHASPNITSLAEFHEVAVTAQGILNKQAGVKNPKIKARSDSIHDIPELYARIHSLNRHLESVGKTLKEIAGGKKALKGDKSPLDWTGVDIETIQNRYPGMPNDAVQLMAMIEHIHSTGGKTRAQAIGMLQKVLDDVYFTPARKTYGLGVQPYGGMISQYGAEGAQ